MSRHTKWVSPVRLILTTRFGFTCAARLACLQLLDTSQCKLTSFCAPLWASTLKFCVHLWFLIHTLLTNTGKLNPLKSESCDSSSIMCWNMLPVYMLHTSPTQQTSYDNHASETQDMKQHVRNWLNWLAQHVSAVAINSLRTCRHSSAATTCLEL